MDRAHGHDHCQCRKACRKHNWYDGNTYKNNFHLTLGAFPAFKKRFMAATLIYIANLYVYKCDPYILNVETKIAN